MKLPSIVTKIVHFCDCWIVGSAVDSLEPRDIDIFVPIEFWQQASSYIPKDAKINTMGGFKFIDNDIEVDMWTGNFNDFLLSDRFKVCKNIRTGIVIRRELPHVVNHSPVYSPPTPPNLSPPWKITCTTDI